MALLAPTRKAKVSTTTHVKPGLLDGLRRLWRRSCNSVFITTPLHNAPVQICRTAITIKVYLKGGERLKSTNQIYGWDLEFRQNARALRFDYFYAPCQLADLGVGTLGNFKVDLDQANFKDPKFMPVRYGHVYLLNQQAWKHWVLFKVELVGQNEAK